jgi:hypothetical protein
VDPLSFLRPLAPHSASGDGMVDARKGVMTMKRASFVAGFAAVLALAAPAAADLAPPDSCTAPDQPCSTAGPSFNQAGICTMTTCTKSVPAADGGFTTMSYACNHCVARADGGGGSTGAAGSMGAAGSTGAAGSSGAAGHAGATVPPTPGKSSGCAVAPGTSPRSAPGFALAFAVWGLMVARRRRRR